MHTLYTIGIYCMGLGIRIAALFSQKAKAWIVGRKDLFNNLRSQVTPGDRWLWVHAASLGEFEQGRPLIERVKAEYPGIRILLTFFSPSGYEVRKEYEHADYVTYMPLDTPGNARSFIELLKPIAAVFVKYEIWYHHLAVLEEHSVPTFLISSNLREGQIYFSPPGQFICNRLKNLTKIFTQTSTSEKFLQSRGFRNVVFAGDTRLDRVLEIARHPRNLDWLGRLMPDNIVVAGSTWPEDEGRLIPALLRSDMAAIIAPHEIHDSRIEGIISKLPGAVRYSGLKARPQEARYVIVDTIGDLAYLYALGVVAYVGGAFKQGLHNVLEPVAHRLPVVIGPEFSDYAEAIDLVSRGVVYPISNEVECAEAIDTMMEHRTRTMIKTQIDVYISENQGATETIFHNLEDLLKGSEFSVLNP